MALVGKPEQVTQRAERHAVTPGDMLQEEGDERRESDRGKH